MPPSGQAKATQTSIKGFSELEVAFLTEEIVDESCYVRPGVIQLSSGKHPWRRSLCTGI